MSLPKTVCALDLGKARVGVAISDDLLYAHARPPLDGHKRRPLLAAVAELARREGVARFLVGLPLDPSGQPGLAAQRAIAFAEQVANLTGVEVEMVDERFTTVEAQAQLHASGYTAKTSRAHIDGVSAAVMLQSWLDARKG